MSSKKYSSFLLLPLQFKKYIYICIYIYGRNKNKEETKEERAAKIISARPKQTETRNEKWNEKQQQIKRPPCGLMMFHFGSECRSVWPPGALSPHSINRRHRIKTSDDIRTASARSIKSNPHRFDFGLISPIPPNFEFLFKIKKKKKREEKKKKKKKKKKGEEKKIFYLHFSFFVFWKLGRHFDFCVTVRRFFHFSLIIKFVWFDWFPHSSNPFFPLDSFRFGLISRIDWDWGGGRGEEK